MIAFERIPEPALMDDQAQVDAYASADWSEGHDRLMRQILDYFPLESLAGTFLNLGCGPGDDTGCRHPELTLDRSAQGLRGAGGLAGTTSPFASFECFRP